MVLNLNFFCRRSYPAILLILLAGITVYANTFHVPFLLDDHLWITHNEFIKRLDIFFSNSSKYNSRFVGLFTLALNFHFGGFNVTGYHVINLIIHLLTALMVYVLLRLTFRAPYFQMQVEQPVQVENETGAAVKDLPLQPSSFIPLFAALLFVVHPVQTQAVTYIVQRMTSLATLLYLLSVVLYAKARLSIEKSKESKMKSGFRGQESGNFKRKVKIGLLFAGSVLSAVLAMKTKEIAFTLPFVVLLYEACFFQGPWRRRLLFLLPLLATLPIIPMGVVATSQTLSAGHPAVQTAAGMLADVGEQLRASTHLARMDYLFTQFRVIVTYLRLLVLPINQNLDYDYPVYHSFFTPQVFLSFFFLASIFGLACFLLWRTRKSRKGNVQRTAGLENLKLVSQPQPPLNPSPGFSSTCLLRLVAFGILWFFLALSVESSFVPILDVIAEHRLYLPSIGAAAAFSAAFFLIVERFFRSSTVLSILAGAIIILALSFATHQRNNVWGNAVKLWEDVVSKSPQKPKPLNNLGLALNDAGRPWEAIPILKRAIDISYKYDMANYNLGRSYLLIDQSSVAIPLFREAIKINPDLTGAYSDLGAALIKDKRYKEAITLLEKNMDRLDEIPEVYFNLGVAYYNSGYPAKARRELEILSRLDHRLATRLADYLR